MDRCKHDKTFTEKKMLLRTKHKMDTIYRLVVDAFLLSFFHPINGLTGATFLFFQPVNYNATSMLCLLLNKCGIHRETDLQISPAATTMMPVNEINFILISLLDECRVKHWNIHLIILIRIVRKCLRLAFFLWHMNINEMVEINLTKYEIFISIVISFVLCLWVEWSPATIIENVGKKPSTHQRTISISSNYINLWIQFAWLIFCLFSLVDFILAHAVKKWWCSNFNFENNSKCWTMPTMLLLSSNIKAKTMESTRRHLMWLRAVGGFRFPSFWFH